MPEGQRRHEGDVQGLRHLLEDLLRVGRRVSLVRAGRQVAGAHAHDPVELSRVPQLLQHAVDAVGALADLLDHQDRAPRVDLPGGSDTGAEEHQVAAQQPALAGPRSPGASHEDLGHGSGAREVFHEGAQRVRLDVAPAVEHRAVEAHEPRAAPLPEQERRDVAVAHQRLSRGAHGEGIE